MRKPNKAYIVNCREGKSSVLHDSALSNDSNVNSEHQSNWKTQRQEVSMNVVGVGGKGN